MRHLRPAFRYIGCLAILGHESKQTVEADGLGRLKGLCAANRDIEACGNRGVGALPILAGQGCWRVTTYCCCAAMPSLSRGSNPLAHTSWAAQACCQRKLRPHVIVLFHHEATQVELARAAHECSMRLEANRSLGNTPPQTQRYCFCSSEQICSAADIRSTTSAYRHC